MDVYESSDQNLDFSPLRIHQNGHLKKAFVYMSLRYWHTQSMGEDEGLDKNLDL